MVAISFSKFKEKLLNGEKRQTIRKHNPERIEQMKRLGIQIYWKQRSANNSEKLFDAKLTDHFKLRFVEDATRYPFFLFRDHGPWAAPTDEFMDELAQKDGFKDYKEMVLWFKDEYGDELFESEYDVIRFEKKSEMASSRRCEYG